MAITTNPNVTGVPVSGGGGGAVDSVNGQTGVVVLDASDVSAASLDGSSRLPQTQLPLAGLEGGSNVTVDENTKRALLFNGAGAKSVFLPDSTNGGWMDGVRMFFKALTAGTVNIVDLRSGTPTIHSITAVNGWVEVIGTSSGWQVIGSSLGDASKIPFNGATVSDGYTLNPSSPRNLFINSYSGYPEFCLPANGSPEEAAMVGREYVLAATSGTGAEIKVWGNAGGGGLEFNGTIQSGYRAVIATQWSLGVWNFQEVGV